MQQAGSPPAAHVSPSQRLAHLLDTSPGDITWLSAGEIEAATQARLRLFQEQDAADIAHRGSTDVPEVTCDPTHDYFNQAGQASVRSLPSAACHMPAASGPPVPLTPSHTTKPHQPLWPPTLRGPSPLPSLALPALPLRPLALSTPMPTTTSPGPVTSSPTASTPHLAGPLRPYSTTT